MRRKKPRIVLEKVLVEDYAAEGKSLAKLDGKVIFIEGGVPGDIVDIQLGKNKKDWAEGRVMRFHSYSPDRVSPFCQHFGVCGGCQWQMLPYDKQLIYKQKQVRDNLQRIGKISLPEIRPILGALETQFYRNKIEYTFGTKEFLPESAFRKHLAEKESVVTEFVGGSEESLTDGSKEVRKGIAGFHARGFFDKIVDIQSCYLQAEPTNEIRLEVKRFAIERGYSFYDIRNHEGFLRNMQVRLCTTGELMVNIVVGEKQDQKIKGLLDHLLQKFPAITTLLYTINTKKNDSLFDLEPVVYNGKGYVIENLEDFKFKIGPKSFFQTNTRQAERLYRAAREMAELTGKETVYDLYCGTGSIGIFVSRHAKKIVGVELIEAAIADAKENAALNNLSDTAFFAGDVIDICNDDFFAIHGKPDVIITDPPRAGMHEKLVRKILDIA
ncbi:MAG TPA: class I SAM-dependent RNA methyltransferase, partial [Chitinophagaceae bacterium]|nr:class I SAM-dependent RNA methyltransferase [Chitinophagaceae bacterium]